jgi:hypothetical protein
VIVRARASVARGVEEKARRHRPRDREITRGRIRGASERGVERHGERERVCASGMDAERDGARERGGRETTRTWWRRGEGGDGE